MTTVIHYSDALLSDTVTSRISDQERKTRKNPSDDATRFFNILTFKRAGMASVKTHRMKNEDRKPACRAFRYFFRRDTSYYATLGTAPLEIPDAIKIEMGNPALPIPA